MSPVQALQTVAIVVRVYKGTFEEHKALDEALNVLLKLIDQPKESEEITVQ